MSQRMNLKLTILILFLTTILYAQERFADIDGHRFRVKTMGSGEKCVVFENGMSDSLEVWKSIPDSVAQFARVFLYDRADIAKSDSSWQARTIPNVVAELRSILANENIQPPYVLAGHSLGGLIDRYFASEYPHEIEGMILFDPAPEAFWKRMSKKELKDYVDGGNEWYETRFTPQYRKEWYEFIPNLKYMHGLNINPDLPVILISASAWNWAKYQSKIIKDYKSARVEVWDGTHYAHIEHADSTIERIKELVVYPNYKSKVIP